MIVLVATDGSAPAAIGIRLIAGIDWPPGTTIRVVSAVDTGSALFGGPWPTAALVQAAELETELRANGERIVREAAAPLAGLAVVVETAVLEGRPATVITDEAERIGADLIVVGSRGHGAIESMLLGSTTAEILDGARAPVLVARGTGVGRIVLAWDGSPAAERAASIIETWPFLRRSAVRVVTVSEVGVPWWAATADAGAPELIPAAIDAMDAARAEHQQLNAELTTRLKDAGLEAEGETRDGDAAQELLATAATGIDLIVMGTHGRTGLARLALGSVARNVVGHATCSVLVVRGPSTGGDRPAA